MTLRDERDNLLDELGGYGSVSIKEDATGFTYVDFESTPFIDDNKCYNIGLQMNLGPLNVIKKPLLGKIKGTVIEKLLRDHDVLRDGMI